MKTYQVSIQVGVPDVEADSKEEAIEWVKKQIISAFDWSFPPKFYIAIADADEE